MGSRPEEAPQRLTRLLGAHKALKIMLEGAALDPEAALEIGYVDEVVPPDELLDQALTLADRLARRSSLRSPQ